MISTIIDVGLLKILLILNVDQHLAVALGFLAGLTNGYLMNSKFVFQVERQQKSYWKYFLISAIALILTEWIIEILNVQLKAMTPMEAKIVAVVIVFFWNYFASKKWAFKS